MNYVYDVLANFTYPLIDFYEWDSNDYIENFKKIPLFKVKHNVLLDFKYYKFKIHDIEKIKDEGKLFNKKACNAAIYTDGMEALIFKFNKDGVCIGKSSILLDEEDTIIRHVNSINIDNITYDKYKKDRFIFDKTRMQNKIVSFLVDEIGKVDDTNKLEYISYECTGDILSRDSLINYITNKWDDNYYKIYDFFKSIPMNKS